MCIWRFMWQLVENCLFSFHSLSGGRIWRESPREGCTEIGCSPGQVFYTGIAAIGPFVVANGPPIYVFC